MASGKRRRNLTPLLILAIFLSVALWRFLATGNSFYLFNFGYLGLALSCGIFLATRKADRTRRIGRIATEAAVGLYLMVYVGFIQGENIQVEGFWLYLFAGIFAGSTLHYLIAKIGGPFIFGRGWCGWACWTAMVMDLLPYRTPQKGIARRASYFRYGYFALALIACAVIYFLDDATKAGVTGRANEVRLMLMGNLAYYIIAITLAVLLRDNRAFCRYVCPIPVFQKIGARYALIKQEIDGGKCIDCGKCEKACMMGIKLLDYKARGERINSTECVLCQECGKACPTNAIRTSLGTRKVGRPKAHA